MSGGYFTRTRRATRHMVFRLPFGGGSLDFVQLSEMYEEFITAMDGQDDSSCLAFYYERNPVTSIYEFRDADAEADIADVMGMDIQVCSDGESLSESQERKQKEEFTPVQPDNIVQKINQQAKKVKDPSDPNTMLTKVKNMMKGLERATGPKKEKAITLLRDEMQNLLDKHPNFKEDPIIQQCIVMTQIKSD
uniref:Uncharacterized protein n=1 Tax=Clandestinovirus TaxID=2831644 RepID=A0A8F8PQP5_9VIRU|nr:hypothetical protein KOM_12_39 [Clandestinovirus]